MVVVTVLVLVALALGVLRVIGWLNRDVCPHRSCRARPGEVHDTRCPELDHLRHNPTGRFVRR